MIESAKKRIKELAFLHKKPVVLCSFGKDSMAMLHLTRSMGFFWPVLFFRHPWFPEKNKFADEIIQQWGLETWDYPPCQSGVQSNEKEIEIVATHQVGPGAGIHLPMGILSPQKGKRFLCGRFDVLDRPKGNFMFPWDIMFIGHRSADIDPIYGPIPLKEDLHQAKNSPPCFYPLKDWSDNDVWNYIEENKVPVQLTRYNLATRKELSDKTFNPDWYPVCTLCIDKRQPAMVMCPIVNKEIANVSGQVPDTKQKFSYIANAS